MNKSTEWYQANRTRPGLRDEYNARQRKWYRENIEAARAVAREKQKIYRERNPEKCKNSTERCRVARGKRNRAYIDDYKSKHPCIRCGESDPIVLDLHHRNPDEKEFTISKWMFRASLKSLDKEFAKCDVLCANCHRREHYRVTKSGIGESKC